MRKELDEALMEQAIQSIMEFYRVTRDVAVELYWDEIEAYMKLLELSDA